MDEVKNEGLEVVAWLCSWIAGSYGGMHAGLSETSLDGLRKDRGDDIQIITDEPLCRHSEALAGYAVRDARIAELELLAAAISADCNDMANERNQFRAELDASKFCADVADDLRAELSEIKAQEPVDGALLDDCEECSHPEFGRGYFFTDDCVRQLYAAPVAKQVVMPDADHSEDVRTMVLPEGYKLVPIEPTAAMFKAAKVSGVIDPRVSGYCYQLMLAASTTPGDSQ